MDTGYIKLWRALIEKPIWLLSTPEQRSVLIVILLSANHKGHEWEWSGKKFEVDPGQFVTSLESLRKKSGAGISTQNVRSALRRFEKLEFLTNKATKSGRLISVINWESYQPKDKEGQQRTQQRGNKGATPNKNDKNVIKEKEKKFNIFWDVFGHKDGKEGAWRSWKKISMNDELFNKIIAGARRYCVKRKEILKRGSTPKMAQGWLTDKRWEDEITSTETKRYYVDINK